MIRDDGPVRIAADEDGGKDERESAPSFYVAPTTTLGTSPSDDFELKRRVVSLQILSSPVPRRLPSPRPDYTPGTRSDATTAAPQGVLPQPRTCTSSRPTGTRSDAPTEARPGALPKPRTRTSTCPTGTRSRARRSGSRSCRAGQPTERDRCRRHLASSGPSRRTAASTTLAPRRPPPSPRRRAA